MEGPPPDTKIIPARYLYPMNPATAFTFRNGQRMKNRFMLAPLTNKQSQHDGILSDGELNWLQMRAQGQFGLVMTCATSVQHCGRSWPGQLGIHTDAHVAGHERITAALREQGALSVTQLHHGGMRSSEELTGVQPLCPSDHAKYNARAMTLAEIEETREAFITAAKRAQQAGYDGVEIHGAHGYLIAQFLSGEINQRTDAYGGSRENRARLLWEVIEGVRKACGDDFLLGVRLSPERFGMELSEVKALSQQLIDSGKLDFLDISIWDVFKQPEGETGSKTLLEYFTELDRKEVKLTVAGKIRSGQDVQKVLDAGVDFVTIGRSGILHHDFPAKVMADPHFEPTSLPVSKAYLQEQGLSAPFIGYMSSWKGFVKE